MGYSRLNPAMALNNTYQVPTYMMGAGGVTVGSSSGSAPLSSTVFPCGHIVGYTGVPPKYCTSCGAKHQNMTLHDQNYYSNVSMVPGDNGTHMPVDWAIAAAGQAATSTQKAKSKTPNKDWLDVQVDNVRKLAFHG